MKGRMQERKLYNLENELDEYGDELPESLK
jgi:hypothetical protein